MLFFSSQASLLIDTTKLVEDAGAEFPALVTIRYSHSIPAYMATALEWDFLRMLPDEDVISSDGWDILCAYDAIQKGKDVDEADDIPRSKEHTSDLQSLLSMSYDVFCL